MEERAVCSDHLLSLLLVVDHNYLLSRMPQKFSCHSLPQQPAQSSTLTTLLPPLIMHETHISLHLQPSIPRHILQRIDARVTLRGVPARPHPSGYLNDLSKGLAADLGISGESVRSDAEAEDPEDDEELPSNVVKFRGLK